MSTSTTTTESGVSPSSVSSTGMPPSSSGGSSAKASPNWRTLMFVGVAAACLAITGVFEFASRPAPIKDYGKVGQPFFPEFVDPTLATELEVHAFDADAVSKQEFIVKQLANGRWTIPSRHDYPADAEDKLAKTAASVIGIERGAMVTRWPAEHARYGVVDPGQDALNVDEVEGVGKRLILRGEGDELLVDYIIGDQPDSNGSGEYYVRRQGEDDVYITKLSIDLSTKFTDWIDTDLLHIGQFDLRQLTINDYSFDELQGTITKAETSVLTRGESSDPWVLEGLNEETEEVDKDAMQDAANAIADMKIVGVRQKRRGLSPELTLDRNEVQSQNDVTRLQNDLIGRGFLLRPGEEPESLKLVAREGELYASTDDGLTYRMHFGRAFTGTQDELEFELSTDESGDSEETAKTDDDAAGEESSESGESDQQSDGSDETGDDKSTDEDADDDDDEDESDSTRPGRYVFVRVEFDEANLDDRPVEPVAPEMPEELKQAVDEPDAADADDAAAEESDDGDSDSDGDSEQAEEDPLAKARKEYETAQKDYELDKMTYDSDLEKFEKKIKDGQKKADDLNRRFAEWYYVVSGETFDKLRLSRADIVKAKEEEEDDSDDSSADLSETSDSAAEENVEPDSESADSVNSDSDDGSSDDSDVSNEVAPEEPGEEESATEEQAANDGDTEESADESAIEDPAQDDSTGGPQDTPLDSEPTEDSTE